MSRCTPRRVARYPSSIAIPVNPDLEESDVWLDRLKSGDDRAFAFLWEQFFHRMVDVARKKIPSRLRVDRDEEDVALSAFKSFCLGFQAGRFRKTDSVESLWPLLVTLTINKANDHLRRSLRKKRSIGDGRIMDDAIDVDNIAGVDFAPELQLAADEVLDQVVSLMESTQDDDLVAIILSALQGNSTQEIAESMNCSVRTVQRKLKTIHRLWESLSK